MKRKNLKSNAFEPQLVGFYRSANKQTFGVLVRVPSRHYKRFKEFEHVLQDMNISCREYAYATVKMLESWVHKKGLSYVPVNTFTGTWLLTRYLRTVNSETVSIDVTNDKDDMLLYSELQVARMYIYHGGTRRMSDVVNDLRPLLHDEWLDAYARGSGRPIAQALEMLSNEFGIHASSYADIVTWQTNTATH